MKDAESFEDSLKVYPLNDLLDIKIHLDREKYPDRYALLLEEINRRYDSGELLVTKQKGKYETGTRRFWAAIIDDFILWGAGFLEGLLLNNLEPNFAFFTDIVFFWLFVAYSVYLHWRYGQTVGKMVVGVVVLDISETRLSMKQAILRDIFPVGYAGIAILADLSSYFGPNQFQSALRLFLAADFYIYPCWEIIELLTMLSNRKRRAVHDFIAGTVVVNKEALKPKLSLE